MKRNRNSVSYRVNHWFNVRGWEELGQLVWEISAAIGLFGALFLLPHLFH